MKKIFSVLLAITLMLSAIPLNMTRLGIFADAASADYLTFTPNDDGQSFFVSFCNMSASGELVIPSIYNGKPVTGIGDYAFYGCSGLTSVTIPDSVTAVGEVAFFECSSLAAINVSADNKSFSSSDGVLFNKNKTELVFCPAGKSGAYTIPNGVTSIGNESFCYCNLSSVTIPDSVTYIGTSAFSACSSLAAINVSADNKSYSSSDGVLFNKNKTELICCPGGKSGDYTIPDSVKVIDELSFYFCGSLTSVTIPAGVTDIGDYTFCFCSSLASVTIPDSVTSIGSNAFEYCSSLVSVTIPDGITGIGSNAFGWCSSLSSITIPDSVTDIGNEAFCNCSSLTSVTIGNSVMRIGDNAFYFCAGLTSLTIGNSVTSIGNNAFYNCSSLTSVTLPDGVTGIGSNAFAWCSSLASITLPDSVTSLGTYAFYYCRGLTFAKIPDGVTSIGAGAFYCCDALTVYAKPGSAAALYAENNSIPWAAYCDHIHTETRAALEPSSCSQAGYTAGVYCLDCEQWISGHEDIIIEHTDSDNDGMCDVCKTRLSDIFPGETKSIDIVAGETAFLKFTPAKTEKFTFKSFSSDDTYCCLYDADMKMITCDDDSGDDFNFKINYTLEAGKTYYFGSRYTDSTKNGSFDVLLEIYTYSPLSFTLNSDGNSYSVSYCEKNFEGELVIPSTYNGKPVTGICDYAFRECGNITAVKISKGLTNIGYSAFEKCSSLTAATIPEGVTYISGFAFAYCGNLTSVTIPDSVESIENMVFDGCNKLTVYGFAGSCAQRYAFDYDIPFVVIDISAAGDTEIDYENKLIFAQKELLDTLVGVTVVPAKFTMKATPAEGLFYGTGSKVEVYNGASLLNEYTLIINGDLNGDSVCDVLDAAVAERMANSRETATDIQCYAANGCADSRLDVVSYQNVVNASLA